MMRNGTTKEMEMNERTTLEREYKAALRICKSLESGSNEKAWLEANDRLTVARKAMVAAQIANPTKSEIKKTWAMSFNSWRN